MMETVGITDSPIKKVKILAKRRPDPDSATRRTIAEQFGEWHEDRHEHTQFIRALRQKGELQKTWSENGKVTLLNKPPNRCSTLAETAKSNRS